MRCYIGIGSNLGDRQGNIDSAVQKLREATGIEVRRISRIYETEPVGGPPQPKYLNGAIEIETEFAPRQILDILLGIESGMGRIRTVRNAPRVIDLDILTCANLKIDEPDLKIPHPRMAERDFVKEPLKDLMQ